MRLKRFLWPCKMAMNRSWGQKWVLSVHPQFIRVGDAIKIKPSFKTPARYLWVFLKNGKITSTSRNWISVATFGRRWADSWLIFQTILLSIIISNSTSNLYVNYSNFGIISIWLLISYQQSNYVVLVLDDLCKVQTPIIITYLWG